MSNTSEIRKLMETISHQMEESIETVLGQRGQEIKVFVNPPKQALKNLLTNTRDQEVRGLFDDGKFFFWDSFEMTHDDMADELGLERDRRRRNHLYITPDRATRGKETTLHYRPSVMDALTSEPYIQRVFDIRKKKRLSSAIAKVKPVVNFTLK